VSDLKNNRTLLLVAAAVVVAGYALYSFASNQWGSAAASPVDRSQIAGQANRPAETQIDSIRLDLLQPQTGSFRSQRNLFAFYEPPPPPPAPPPPPPPDRDGDGIPDHLDNCPDVYNPDQNPEACQPVQPQAPRAPEPPPFNYRFLGTFGPAGQPIAAFSGNGEIVNVRVGETIGGRFVLRSINIESVDIGFVGFPADVKRRVAVGQ
jgi:hypothetical protein